MGEKGIRRNYEGGGGYNGGGGGGGKNTERPERLIKQRNEQISSCVYRRLLLLQRQFLLLLQLLLLLLLPPPTPTHLNHEARLDPVHVAVLVRKRLATGANGWWWCLCLSPCSGCMRSRRAASTEFGKVFAGKRGHVRKELDHHLKGEIVGKRMGEGWQRRLARNQLRQQRNKEDWETGRVVISKSMFSKFSKALPTFTSSNFFSALSVNPFFLSHTRQPGGGGRVSMEEEP